MAFWLCKSLRSIKYPEMVGWIFIYLFYLCFHINTDVICTYIDSRYKISNDAFYLDKKIVLYVSLNWPLPSGKLNTLFEKDAFRYHYGACVNCGKQLLCIKARWFRLHWNILNIYSNVIVALFFWVKCSLDNTWRELNAN